MDKIEYKKIAYLLGCYMVIVDKEINQMDAENGGYPPTQNGDIRSLFWLFSLMALQN